MHLQLTCQFEIKEIMKGVTMKLLCRSVLTSILLSVAMTATSFAQQSDRQSASQPAGQPTPSLPLARLSEAQTIAALKEEVAKRAAADQFSGVVLIAKDGKPLFQQAYGYADSERKIPNALDTKFIFGSMGKMFTSVAVAQLAQAGKLSYDDPLSKYLPDYPNPEVAKVTIHQLLTHTGGTGDFFGPEFFAHHAELKELKDYVALYGNREPRFPPGSKWEYSNYGMILAGRIVEVVSGQSYNDYLQEHIFKPAKMKSTGNPLEGQQVKGLAINYTRVEPGQPPPPMGVPLTGPLHASGEPLSATPAGGGYSTVGDFLRFATALTSNKLLSAQYTELVTTGKVDAPPPRGSMPAGRPMPGARMGSMKYAYGFMDMQSPDGLRHVGHSGASPGQNSVLAIYAVSGYVVVVMANRDGPAADELARFLDQRVPLK
jgi:CubicO group peptidase (beta-lactamase class C family)